MKKGRAGMTCAYGYSALGLNDSLISVEALTQPKWRKILLPQEFDEIVASNNKFDKATIVCGAFCMSAISLGSAYAGVNILIDTPEWLKLTTTVIETIGCLCFIGLLGLMGLKFAKVSSEIRNPGKIYFKILSAMMLILFAFMASNFIVNLFGGTVPSLLNSIMGWSLYATFGVLVLVGVVHLCAYAIDKITRC